MRRALAPWLAPAGPLAMRALLDSASTRSGATETRVSVSQGSATDLRVTAPTMACPCSQASQTAGAGRWEPGNGLHTWRAVHLQSSGKPPITPLRGDQAFIALCRHRTGLPSTPAPLHCHHHFEQGLQAILPGLLARASLPSPSKAARGPSLRLIAAARRLPVVK